MRRPVLCHEDPGLTSVIRQTADTFRASATFLDLLGIWDKPGLDPEIESKIKFAKYHALRIAKALKAGEDPNLTNPKPEPAPEQEAPPLDPNDPDVQIINNAAAMQPTVEDEELPSISPPSAPNDPPVARDHVSHVSPLQPPGPPAASHLEVSPIEPSPANERAGSEGGGYFPEVPTFTSEQNAPQLPTAPPDDVEMKSPGGSLDPSDFYTAQAPPVHSSAGPPAVPAAVSPALPSAPTPSIPRAFAPPQPVPVNNSNSQAPASYRTDDEATALATKHAKWAISALNFEDVNTAVKELRNALRALGAN